MSADPPQARSPLRAMLPKLVISLLLGALFAWLVSAGGVPLLPPLDKLTAVPLSALAIYGATALLTHFFRASRWRHLIAPYKPIPLRDTILLNWIGFFAIFALPLRLGELARPALTKARERIPMSVGVGTVAVERVVDGIMTSLCVAWALFALPRLPTRDPVVRLLPSYGLLSLLLFAGAFLALALFLWQRRAAARAVAQLVGIVSPSLATRVAEKVAGVADGLRAVADGPAASKFLLETLVYWALNAVGMWQLGVACGLPMSAGQAVGLMGILAIGILLPAGPGLFGNFQLALATGLKLYFAGTIVTEEGAVYVFLLYTIQGAMLTITGIVPLFLLRIPFASLLRMTAEDRRTPPVPTEAEMLHGDAPGA